MPVRLIALVCVLLLGGCGDDGGEPLAPQNGDPPEATIYITDQADLDALAGVTHIDGTLYIQSGCDTCVIDDLSPLSELVEVGGLVIGNTAVQDLAGLAALESCAGELRIWGNAELRSLVGLESLTSARSVELLGNPLLETVAALGSVSPQRLHLAALDRLTTADVFADLSGLEELSVRRCPRLRVLPRAPAPALQQLEVLELDSLSTLDLAGGGLPLVIKVEVRSLPLLVELPSLPDCARLQRLTLTDLPSLTGLPDLTHLEGLGFFTLRNLASIDRLDDLSGLSLRDLTLDDMPALTDLAGLTSLPGLRWLTVRSCENLVSLAGAEDLPRLRWVELKDNPRLTGFGDIGFADGIEQLAISDCGFTDLSSFAGLGSCTTLSLLRCPDLRSLTGLASFLVLEDLQLEQLPALGSLGAMAAFPRLERLVVRSCDELENLVGIEGLPRLETFSIQSCASLRGLEGPGYPSALREIRISSNHALTSLDGLADITSIADLTISRNTALGDSAAFAFADGLEFVEWVNIYGNDP